MRTIKFRAWDNNEMIYLENSGLQYFDFEGSYSLGFTVDGYSEFWAHEQYDTISERASKYPLMQFTGVKDKNNKDIYESDILSFEGYPNGIVTFEKGSFGYESTYGFIPLHETNLSITEVIGNIYDYRQK